MEMKKNRQREGGLEKEKNKEEKEEKRAKGEFSQRKKEQRSFL